jgi:NADPH2:quinone reductase
MKAVVVHAPGGPEVLRYEDAPAPVAGEGQVVVQIEAAGVNFIDVYQRMGLYRVALPLTLGQEAAGTVRAVGAGVTDVKTGDRVVWQGVLGAYAEHAAVPAASVVRVPDGVTTRQAAAAMLQGMTAHYLACDVRPLERGSTCLVHAAAGGVGLLLCQIAKKLGARVIGTVSTRAKAALAAEAGADETILDTERDFELEVRRFTGGAGVDVVYDSVGRTTFAKSLRCVARRGMLVLFGQSSGPVEPFDPQLLNQHGSLFLTRPKLGDYVATRQELLDRAGEVLKWVKEGALKLRIDLELPLSQVAEAHRMLEARRTTGKILLVPGS